MLGEGLGVDWYIHQKGRERRSYSNNFNEKNYQKLVDLIYNQLTWYICCGTCWGPPECWWPTFDPICGGYRWWKEDTEGGLDCNDNGGCRGGCSAVWGIPVVCIGCWSGGFEAEWRGSWVGSWEDCGEVIGIDWTLSCCGGWRVCEPVTWGWRFGAGAATVGIGIGGFWGCFLAEICTWAALACSWKPTELEYDWACGLGCCNDCAGGWGCWDAAGGIFGICREWKSVITASHITTDRAKCLVLHRLRRLHHSKHDLCLN